MCFIILGVLQALGLTGLSSYKPEALVSNIMASQSLAALAQQGKTLLPIKQVF